MDKREELKALIAQADELLKQDPDFYTRGAKLALQDMIDQAVKALNNNGERPFTLCREFSPQPGNSFWGEIQGQPADFEAVGLALGKFTMVPSYSSGQKDGNRYGLAEAVSWYRRQDVRLEEDETLQQRAERILRESDELLAGAQYGERIGQYDPACAERLTACCKALRQALLEKRDRDIVAAALVKSIDALRDFRFSRVLRSDVEERPLYRLNRESLKRIRENVRQNPFYRKQYDKIVAAAGEIDAEKSRLALKSIDGSVSYEKLNEQFVIWGDTGRVINLTTPPGTVGARLSFCLPQEDNEEEGLGHIWLKGISLESVSGQNAKIENPDFEAGKDERGDDIVTGWKFVKEKGNPVLYRDAGKKAVYLCNPAPGDQACLLYDGIVKLKEGTGYTLFFRAKQDGKFRKGLEARLEFIDAGGAVLGEFVYTYNRKSWMKAGSALSMQCSAICYAVEGNREQAVKAKQDMLYFLNDFCQGARHWKLYNMRPEGIDAYGAVQCGRVLCSLASACSLIRDADVFSQEERNQFYDMVDYLVRYCLDLRDRTELSTERVQRGSGNWQTDMCCGVAAVMMVLPDFPNRKSWLYNAQAVLRGQLESNLNPDGSWPESLRYHFSALEHFAGFVSAWKNETGEDWLASTRFADMFSYPIVTITPPYSYFDNRIATPPFGDHELTNGKEFALFGMYLEMVAQKDKRLADQMFLVWKNAGFPVKGLWGESLAIETLTVADPGQYQTEKGAELRLLSDTSHTQSGIMIFRSGRIYRADDSMENAPEHYLAVMCSPRPIAHGHLDQGSFILYYDNVPVVMDTGVEGYFNASVQWHLSSCSHACLQFQTKRQSESGQNGIYINLNAGNYSNKRGWEDAPRFSRLLSTQTGDTVESLEMETDNPAGQGVHRRSFHFNRLTGELDLKDRVRDFDGKVLFSLPMVMRDARIEGNRVYATGYFGVDMEVIFHSVTESLCLEKGRTTPFIPGEGSVRELIFVRAVARARDGFRVSVRPHRV